MPKLKILFVFVLLLVGVEFALRGPYRFLVPKSRLNDITYIYVPARAMIQGMDPYDPESFARVCQCDIPATDVRAHSAYPWTIYILLAPLALLSWSQALYVWATIQVVFVMLMIRALLLLAELTGMWAAGFVLCALALAPVHTGLASGNVSIAAIALCALAVWAAASRHNVAAGMMLGAALCLKPQIGICFIAYYVLRRNWRVALGGTGVAVAIAGAGFLYLTYSYGMTWLHFFLHNAQGFAANNKFNDFTFGQPMRFTLINLQVLFYSIIGNASFANWLALTLGAMMVGVWSWSVWRNAFHPILLELSVICVASLLPVYHRSYDAALLIFPLCWSFWRMQRACMDRSASVALLLMLPFAVPGAALVQGLAERNYVPAGWVASWWWRSIAMPHEIWLLLFLACWLLYLLALEGDRVPGQIT
jgi:hypothetical protein